MDYLGKAPRGERAQPGIYAKVYYCRQKGIGDANKHVHRVEALRSRPRPFSQDQEATVHHAVPGVGKWERMDHKAFSNAPRRAVLAPLVHESDFGGWISLGATMSCKRRQASCGLGRSILQDIDGHSSYRKHSCRSAQQGVLQRLEWMGIFICWFPHAKPVDPWTHLMYIVDIAYLLFPFSLVYVGLPTLFALTWSGPHPILHRCARLNWGGNSVGTAFDVIAAGQPRFPGIFRIA